MRVYDVLVFLIRLRRLFFCLISFSFGFVLANRVCGYRGRWGCLRKIISCLIGNGVNWLEATTAEINLWEFWIFEFRNRWKSRECGHCICTCVTDLRFDWVFFSSRNLFGEAIKVVCYIAWELNVWIWHIILQSQGTTIYESLNSWFYYFSRITQNWEFLLKFSSPFINAKFAILWKGVVLGTFSALLSEDTRTGYAADHSTNRLTHAI